ncbi:hypothetical protein STEG23_036670, partial [Scotinomys teguina]
MKQQQQQRQNHIRIVQNKQKEQSLREGTRLRPFKVEADKIRKFVTSLAVDDTQPIPFFSSPALCLCKARMRLSVVEVLSQKAKISSILCVIIKPWGQLFLASNFLWTFRQ